MESNVARRHYPRIVGLAPQERRGSSDKWFELLVTGRDQIGGLAKLTALLAQYSVNLAPSGGYYLITPDTFVWTTFADFTHSMSPLERVLGDIRRLDFVSRTSAVEVKGAALDQFLFPVVINNNHRGIIMSLSPLLKAEQRLTEMLGSAGAVLMFEEGKAYARDSMEQLRETIPESEPMEFLDTVASWLRTTGWGIITFDTTRFDDEGTVGVLIREPPNSLTEGKPESHFMNGVVVGIIESVYNRSVNATSSRYDEPSQSLRLVLQAPK
jgi:hypothetical protein